MNKNLIEILVIIILFTSTAVPVLSLPDQQEINPTSFEVDIPVWSAGDKWTYRYSEERTFDPAFSFSGELTYEVMDDSGDSYVLEASFNPQGAFDLGNIGFKTTRFTTESMRLQMRKSDLGLERYQYQIKGILLITMNSITLPIPIQIIANDNIVFEPTWVIIPFPLYDGKQGNLSSVEILHVNATLHLFWGLILAYGPLTESIPFSPMPYTCTEEVITVEAGTFTVYNVSAEWMEGTHFISYYSEEVKNVVKEDILMIGQAQKIIAAINLELIE
jgi:hypothetical protein